MSNVNFLEKLLNDVDVEWKALKDLTLPTRNIKWREANRSYRYIDLTSVNIETKAVTETIEVTSADAPSRAQKLVEKNDVIFATTRPTQKRYCLIEDNYSGEIASTGYCVLRAKQNVIMPKWILHWIASSDFNKYVEENQSGSAYPAISDAKVKEFKIPIPCPGKPKKSLEIQTEIVRILDTMTSHTAELTAELTLRQKQYNYYRDKLLSFEDGEVEWKTLEKITHSIASGRNKIRSDIGEYKVYGSTGLIGYSDKYEYSEDVLLVARVGAYAGLVNAASGKFDVSDNTLIVKPTNEWNIRFAFHQLTNMNINKYAVGAGHPLVTAGMLKSLKVPFPPLAEQVRISNILDKFDTLTASIVEGIPREIELRQKQYEYYRDALLSFPKSNAVSE